MVGYAGLKENSQKFWREINPKERNMGECMLQLLCEKPVGSMFISHIVDPDQVVQTPLKKRKKQDEGGCF